MHAGDSRCMYTPTPNSCSCVPILTLASTHRGTAATRAVIACGSHNAQMDQCEIEYACALTARLEASRLQFVSMSAPRWPAAVLHLPTTLPQAAEPRAANEKRTSTAASPERQAAPQSDPTAARAAARARAAREAFIEGAKPQRKQRRARRARPPRRPAATAATKPKRGTRTVYLLLTALRCARPGPFRCRITRAPLVEIGLPSSAPRARASPRTCLCTSRCPSR